MNCGKPYCVAPVGDWCGEAPLWQPEEQALYWVDINRFLIHRLDRERYAKPILRERPL